MNILIGADFVPTKSNIEYFEKGDIKHLLGEQLAELFSNADYRIFNLEIPLTDKASPISKCGPNLIAHTSAVNGYKTAGIDLLTLANNHILDHGKQGLENTLNVLNDAGINYVGVGKTREQAAKPFVFECDNKKIGVYACAEHEFSVVTDSSAGANPIDLLESPDHVDDRQGHVGVHGGGQTSGHGIQFFPGGDRAGYGRAAHIKPKRAAFGRGSGQRYRGGGLLAGGRIFCGYGPGLHIAVGLFNGREHGVEHGADAKQRSRLIRRCNADRGQLGMRAGGQLLSDHEQFVRIGRRAGEGVLVIELHIGQRHADGGRNIVEANGHCLPPCPMRASQG